MRFAPFASLLLACSPWLRAQDPSRDLAGTVEHAMRAAQKPDAPGGVVLVARGERIVLHRAFGQADLERGVALQPDSVLDIGSTSKQFTAACVLLLVQDGKLALDDSVRKHLGELDACCAPVTIRHLLLHTSGLPDYIGLMRRAGHELEDRTTSYNAMEVLVGVTALDFAAGSRWRYSNSNYFLLSQVVELASGTPLAEFAQQRIFTPLGMQQTHVHVDCTQLVPGRAFSYSRNRGGWRWSFSNWEQAGDGAVMTTAPDLLKWARNFDTGTVGGDALRAAFAQPGALDDGDALEYGMGVMFGDLDGTPIVSHSGAWAAYRAELLRVPSASLTVICLCNRDDLDPAAMCRRFAAAALRGE